MGVSGHLSYHRKLCMIVSRNTKKIMESFIVVSKQLKERQIYINTVCQKENIDLLDITTLISDSGIGIKDIRFISKCIIYFYFYVNCYVFNKEGTI